MESSTIYFKGSQVEIFLILLANSTGPDEMPHLRHFIWEFTACQSNPLGVSSIQNASESADLSIYELKRICHRVQFFKISYESFQHLTNFLNR